VDPKKADKRPVPNPSLVSVALGDYPLRMKLSSRLSPHLSASAFFFAVAVLSSGQTLDLASIDSQVSPGQDFYLYANGGWLARNPIPPEFSIWGSFVELAERNRAILHQILEKTAQADSPAKEGSLAQKLGDFYGSGMDETAINREGIIPLQAELSRIDRVEDLRGFASEIAALHAKGLGPMFDIDGDQDEKDSTSQIAIISQGGLGLPDRDYYLSTDERSKDIRAQYQVHLEKMFELMGESGPAAGADARVVINLETEMAKASKTRVELRDPEANYHKMPLSELEKSAPQFDWETYFQAIGLRKDELRAIDIKQPEFISAVAKLTQDTPLDQWKTYLRWHLIHDLAGNLSQPFVDENFRFYRQVLTGAKENRPRWKRVLDQVNSNLGEALGELYVEKTFPPAAKQRALAMVEDLKVALGGKIQALDWMGDETKKEALAKLSALGVKIGYPDKWRDYSKLEIKRQAYILNVLAGQTFETSRHLARIGKPVDPSEWGMTPQTVNAYYNPNRNEVVFPAGILQPPFFFPNADDAVNYGGIGAVIGHEMTHGFDDQGRHFDSRGNLRDWWTAEDAKRFLEKGTKIVRQFDAYVAIDSLHVNGRLTEGENIADLGGVKIAFSALESALHRQTAKEQELKIDGLTPEQRFFLSWAQIWRTNVRPEQLRLGLQIDPHSPAPFRVNGPLSNLPEFAQAFGISTPSPMIRPEDERVQIW
jgi:putative endopeptidase